MYMHKCFTVIFVLLNRYAFNIVAKPSFVERPIDTLALVGFSAQLNCTVVNLTTTINWFHGEEQLSSKESSWVTGYEIVGDHEEGQYHLFMPDVTKDLGGNYRCHVPGDNKLNGYADLFVIAGKPECDVKPSNNVIADKDMVTFNCTLDLDDNAPGYLVWQQNGVAVKETNETTNIYTRTFNRDDDGAVYSCQFEYSSIPSHLWPQLSCEESIIMNVQYPAIVNITNKTEGILLEGEEFFAKCEVQAFGNPDTVSQWYWIGPDETTRRDGMLRLADVTRIDNGTHTCIAENIYHNNITGQGTASLDINIHYSPLSSISDASGGNVVQGDDYIAMCKADANPPAEFSWTDFDNQVVSNNTELIIPNTDIHSAGTYTCHANNIFFNGDNGYGNSSVELVVQYKPIVTIQSASNGTVIEGYEFKADCNADSNPESDYKWISNDKQVPGKQLVINSTMKSDAGYYTCKAKNTFWNGTQGTGNATIKLDVQYAPVLKVKVHGLASENGEVVNGEDIALECLVEESNPDADLFAWISTNGSWLNITTVSRGDTGIYECVANNTFWDNTRGSGSITANINVEYKPSVTIQSVSNGKVIEGYEFIADCNADSNPESDYKWIYNGGQVTGQQLVINNAMKRHAGYVICEANNTFWNGLHGTGNESFKLDVQYPPTVFLPNYIVGREGQSLSLTCDVTHGNPMETNITWFLVDGTSINNYTVELNDLSKDMAGNYTCSATNAYYTGEEGTGSNETYVDVHYKPSINKDVKSVQVEKEERATIECTIDAHPLDNVTVKWNSKKMDGGNRYEQALRKEKQRQISTLTISSAVSEDVYTCIAENYVGRDEHTITLSLITSMFILIAKFSALFVIFLFIGKYTSIARVPYI